LRFPNLTALSAATHAHGLKLDWYGNSCNCAAAEWKRWGRLPSPSGGNVHADISAFALFGLDGIKIDGCGPAHNISQWAVALAALEGPPRLLENCGDNNRPSEQGTDATSFPWSPPTPQEVGGTGPCGFQM